MVLEGHFREDLFFRINVINITVPPLRDRKEQILPLSQFYFNFYKKKYGRDVPPFSSKMINAFKEYAWPGNIRELETMIKRIVIFGEEDKVLQNISNKKSDDEMNPESYGNLSSNPTVEKSSFNLKELGKRAAEVAEKEIIQSTLQETHWNRKQAAKLLRVSYKALLYKIQKYHLNDLRGYRRIEGETG
jgi:transcriptional regulator with PAS, ATPase and Fis domain